jgi:glycosyltransferase involved in cell wall biosynthesis
LYELDPRLALTVAYCSLQGAESAVDPGFGIRIAWDVPLLEGYRWVHPPNRARHASVDRFFGLINPGLWQLVRRGGYDLVICGGYRAVSFWIAAIAAKLSGSAVVFASDAPWFERPGLSAWMLATKRRVVPRIYRWADGVFVPSSIAVRSLRRAGVPTDKVFLVPNTVDVMRFSRPTGGRLRRQLEIEEEHLAVVFVGKLIDGKRPGDIVEAVAGSPATHLIVVGEGYLRRDLEDLAAAKAPGRVHFVGFINQLGMPDVYHSADVLISASDYDAFPLVVLEAMSAGRAVVASDGVGSIGDLVRDGETGFVYHVGDVAALTQILNRLAADKRLVRQLGQRAQALMGEWSPKQNLEAFTLACEEVTNWHPKERTE